MLEMTEKLCLKWNDFQNNISNAFASLGDSLDFSDVTLACEDGEQMEAHKIILATSSPFFKNLLARNKHTHPLIFMRGVKSEDLKAIMDFLYRGEANVLQDNLDSFLAIAEELKLTGLTRQNDETESEPNQLVDRNVGMKSKNHLKTEQNTSNLPSGNRRETATFASNEGTLALQSKTIVSADHDMHELDQQVKSMMHKSQHRIQSGRQMTTAAICNVCGKEGHPRNISDHIEANHLEGVSIPCNLCQKTFRSRQHLRRHKQAEH